MGNARKAQSNTGPARREAVLYAREAGCNRGPSIRPKHPDMPQAAALLFVAPTAFAKSPSASTPKGESGAATGESGKVSAEQEKAYDATYQSDIAQEKQLKSGSRSK